MSRTRLDEAMVARGISPDIDAARLAIASRTVLVSGSTALKPETLVAKSDPISIEPKSRFVSRGGDKLQGALTDLHIDVKGRRCLDAGAGTGGFTDCLLQNDAASVTAADVGYGQFDWELRRDSRVSLLERTHIGRIPAEELSGAPFDIVVADLSFTSVANLASQLSSLVKHDGDLLVLVKPQFEALRSEVPAGGVVTDPQVWMSCLEKVSKALTACGFAVAGACASRIRGAQGNQEFFLHARRGVATELNRLREAVMSVA